MNDPLAILEEAATAVLTMTEGLEREELLRSRLTRAEVRRQLLLVSSTLKGMEPDWRAALQELDWEGWAATAERMGRADEVAADALWFAVRALTPATMTWLRLYRSHPPERVPTAP